MTRMRNALIGFLLAVAAPCLAHHIRGIPHYSYSDSYPTAPTFEEVRELKNLSLRITYYDIPGTKGVDLALYIKDRHTGNPYQGRVEFAVYGENEDPGKAHSAIAFRNKNNIYKAGWEYEHDGLYMVRVRIGPKDNPVEEVFRMQIGAARINWWYIGACAGGILLLIVLVAAIKQIQKKKHNMSRLPVILLSFLVLAAVVSADEARDRGSEEPAGATAGRRVDKAEPNRCPVCGMIDCKMGCKAETVNAQGERLMVMPGIPDWLFYAGIASVLIVSFVVAEVVGRKDTGSRSSLRFNMLRIRPLKAFVKKPYFQFVMQAPMALGFIWLIYAGLFGHQVINIVPTFTWTVWWAGLIFLVLFGGKVWCLVCPWDFIATATARLRFWGTGVGPLNLGLKWPKWLHNIGPAIFFFIVLTWLELGYHITTSPKFTIYIAIALVVMTFVPGLLFERKPFCRHACFVGRITGLYSTFSPVEVRAADRSICKSCRTLDCYKGNENGNPCPTSLCLATLQDNTYCLKCTECVRSCPNDNVAVNLRPFGEDLFNYTGPRLDEAILAIVLLALTSFHGLTMTPIWENVPQPQGTVIGWIHDNLQTPRLMSFTIGMAGVLLAPILIYMLVCFISGKLARVVGVENPPAFGEIFIKFSYSVLPIALFYHLAHNGMHLFMEGQHVFTLISDPLGRGWDLFGTAAKTFPPILGKDTIWIIQVILVIIGHVYGIILSQKVAVRLFGKGRTSTLVQLPLLIAMILFSFVSLWLMHLDMNMRGTMM